MDARTALAYKIHACRACDNDGLEVEHPPPMVRGHGSHVMVIGVEPGSTEVGSGKAFSGQSGKRLMCWLQDIGVGDDDEKIFENCYFTSIIKCKLGKRSSRSLHRAFKNCQFFLYKQSRMVQPKNVFLLGRDPIKYVLKTTRPLQDLLGRPLYEQDFNPTLFPVFSQNTPIFALPHPSPLSRWHNDPARLAALDDALHKISEQLRV